MADIRQFNSPDVQQPLGGYSQALELSNFNRLVFVSGQIPADKDGQVPTSFIEQGRLVWKNIASQLAAADMTLDNLVKVNIFLSDRQHTMDNRIVREEAIGARTPAMSVIICDIFDPQWLLEIEVIAAA